MTTHPSSPDGVLLPWWSGGLYFSCVMCGCCCGGAPGTVRFSEQEEAAMASAVKLGIEEFRMLYVHNRYGRQSLREKPNYDCIFLEHPIRCRVYGARPSQCRTFPFWHDVLSSRDVWESYAGSCSGMNSGKYYSADEIREILG